MNSLPTGPGNARISSRVPSAATLWGRHAEDLKGIGCAHDTGWGIRDQGKQWAAKTADREGENAGVRGTGAGARQVLRDPESGCRDKQPLKG